ncbi:EamA family transporter RarD [Mariniblastus sp.]|nr:EamA family transporter RarD [Mariniblastus sp.]
MRDRVKQVKSDNPFQSPNTQASDDDSLAATVEAGSGATSNFKNGIVFALLAQSMWGLFPLYLKLLRPTPAINIVAHRIVWAFSFLILLTLIGSLSKWRSLPQWTELLKNIRDAKALRQLSIASVLIGINWLGFVMAIALGRAMDASVGYYICPQFVVLLGVLFEKEQLSPLQWVAFAITSVGVLVMAASEAGLPWFGLLVAFSFGFYGLLKKRITCPAMTSLTFETGILFLPALGFLLSVGIWLAPDNAMAPAVPWVSPTGLQLLLVATGIVTVVPLACHVTAVKRLPMSLVGMLQFLGPTIQFGLSLLVFGETLDRPRLIGIVLIWIGVAFFLRGAQQARQQRVSTSSTSS